MRAIGVLALQGAVEEHINRINRLPGARGIPVKSIEQIRRVDGLILPGGESTAMGTIMDARKMLAPLGDMIRKGLPVWGTCAGMILLAKQISGQGKTYLRAMDIVVRRNAYGSQLDSFHTKLVLPEVSKAPIPLVFIRAPYVESAHDSVTTLARVGGNGVAVRQKNMLATAFHPELTNDLSFHRYFIEQFVYRRAET